MFSSIKRVAVTVFVACGVSFLALGTAGLIAGSSPAVAVAGTCQSGAPTGSAAKPTNHNNASPASNRGVIAGKGSVDSPVLGTGAAVDTNFQGGNLGAGSTPTGSLVTTDAPVRTQSPMTGGSAPVAYTNAPVETTGQGNASSSGGSPLVNTSAPVDTTGRGTAASSGGSGTLVNTSAPVQAQNPTTSGSPLVNTSAPVRAQSPTSGGGSPFVNTSVPVSSGLPG